MIDLAPTISRLGILRLVGFPPSDPDLPARQFGELQAYLTSTKWAELIKQQYHLFPILLAQVRPLYSAGSLGDRPLAVVLEAQVTAVSQSGRICLSNRPPSRPMASSEGSVAQRM